MGSVGDIILNDEFVQSLLALASAILNHRFYILRRVVDVYDSRLQFYNFTSKCSCYKDLNLSDMLMLLWVWLLGDGSYQIYLIRSVAWGQPRSEVGGSERPTDLQLLGTLWLNLDAKRTDWV